MKLRWTPSNDLIVTQTRAVHEKIARSFEFCRSHPLCCLRIDLHLIETPNTPNDIRPESSRPMEIGTYELDSAEAQRLLEMLRSDGQSKVIMAPSLMLLNGQVGIAEVWAERPFDFAGRDGETVTVRLPVAHEGTRLTIIGRADGEGQIQLRCELERRFGDGRLSFSGTIVETEDGQWRVVHLWPEANPAAKRRNLVLFVKAQKMISTFED